MKNNIFGESAPARQTLSKLSLLSITRIFQPKRSIVLVAIAGLLTACADMDYRETESYDRDYVVQEFSRVGGFMTDIYNTADYDYGQTYGGAILGAATDEAQTAEMGSSIDDFYNGAWSASNSKGTMWTSMFGGISACNHFLSAMQGLTFDSYQLSPDYDQQLYRYKNYQWEARFWRAYFYFNLVRQYGGVPLMDHEMGYEEINQLARNSSDEIFEFIFNECDIVMENIIKDYSNLGNMALDDAIQDGRVNNLAAMALKARAALYWASPLFNPQEDKERWHKAALYTQQLLDACQQRGMALTENYADLWATTNWTDAQIKKELIFCRRLADENSTFEKYNYPAGIDGGSTQANCPTQNLVDAYEMQATGLGINEAGSGYNPADPYTGRDPRFEATIAKNGDTWPTAYKKAIETFQGGANGEPLDGATPTGYYLKKYCHGAIDLRSSSKYKKDKHTWITFRLGEFYLNYAEAIYQWLGSPTATNAEFTMSATEAIDVVRKRAGMPNFPATLTNSNFWEKYKNERMVELAFEGHRFWDVRRWKEADKYFKNITQMKITKNEDETFTYTRKTIQRQWDDKMYLFPIPISEILKDPNLEQNPGW